MRLLMMALAVSLAVGPVRSDPRTVVIFHTNDIHGHFMAEPATWRQDTAMVGGLKALDFYLDSLRSAYPASIYVDAGDIMTGNPVCNLEYNGVKGGALQEMLHELGITAACLGNHEFDLGAQHLRDFVSRSPYPILCANVRDHDGNGLLAAPEIQVTVNGIRIGIIGLILDDLKSVVAKANLTSFVVDDAATMAQKLIDELDPKTDLIILLTHLGVDQDSLLATRIRGADVIVGGHSHTRLASPRLVHGVVIVQAGSYCKNLGVLQLAVNGDSISSYAEKLVELVARKTSRTAALSTFADSLSQIINERFAKPIGTAGERWTPSYYTGSNIGNWLCDQLRERYQTNVALVNAGGIRAGFDTGPVTVLDVLEALPFENAITVFNATGYDILKIATEQARAQGEHKHGVLEMSGMDITYRVRGTSAEPTDVKIAGKPICPDSIYRVVTIDYVSVSQPDRYLGFQPRNQENTGEMISEFAIDAIRKSASALKADPEPRLREDISTDEETR